MTKSKIRGIRRKTNNMISQIENSTQYFPIDFYNGYWHMHLPTAQKFISSPKTPFSVKRMAAQTLIDRAQHLIEMKPSNSQTIRVVAAIDLPGYWNSQIIVFSGDSHFNGFFERHENHQRWTALPENRNPQKELGLVIPEGMKVIGFKEEIGDGNSVTHTGDIWFIGELS